MNIRVIHKLFLIGVLSIVLLLTAGCSQTETPEAAPAVSDPGDTSVAQKETAATATPEPSPTPSPTPVLTITPTPEADPRLVLGPSAWGAVFEDGTQTWYQYDHANGKAEVRDDRLVLTSYKANGYDNWSMSYPLMTDFYLELHFTTGPECRGKDRYGILFRAPDSTQGYLYNISCDGAFQVRIWDGQEFTPLIDWTVNEQIIPGPEVAHRLGVWAEGEQYKLYVNGFQVGEFTDSTFIEEGTFGAAHGATDTANFTVYVSEARVWELPAE